MIQPCPFYYGVDKDTLWYSNWPMVPYAPFIYKLNLKTAETKTYSHQQAI